MMSYRIFFTIIHTRLIIFMTKIWIFQFSNSFKFSLVTLSRPHWWISSAFMLVNFSKIKHNFQLYDLSRFLLLTCCCAQLTRTTLKSRKILMWSSGFLCKSDDGVGVAISQRTTSMLAQIISTFTRSTLMKYCVFRHSLVK